MSTLLVVSIFVLFAVGYAIGALIEMAKYDGYTLRHIDHWRSRASTLTAEAKELEQEHRLGEQHDCQIKSSVYLQCANDLYQERMKEPRRII